MNHFELFDIPVSLELEKSLLTKKYYALSMQYHPDRYTMATDDEKRVALDTSTQINEAYLVLKNKHKRMRYVLELSGISFNEGKESVPQDFLMEMMEVNEALMEYKMDPSDVTKLEIEKRLSEIQDNIYSKVSAFITKFSFESNNKDELITLKEYYLKNQYLNNLKQNLNG